MVIKQFEDLEIWRAARVLVIDVYAIKFGRDYGLADQIRRASVSVMSNIAEGFERDSKLEFIRFLYIAKGSCGEVRSQLYLALDLLCLDHPAFQKLMQATKKLAVMIANLISYLRKCEFNGSRYKDSGEEIEQCETTETTETTETIETTETYKIQ